MEHSWAGCHGVGRHHGPFFFFSPTHSTTTPTHERSIIHSIFFWQTALLNQKNLFFLCRITLLKKKKQPLLVVVAQMTNAFVPFIGFVVILQMLKHVHLSPYRSSMMSHHAGGGGGGGGVGSGGRSDTLSLNSTMSCSSLSNQDPLSSRSSSYTSLNESSHNLPQHPPSPMVRKNQQHAVPYLLLFIAAGIIFIIRLGAPLSLYI
jgi:hypothetical protein